MDRGFPCRWLVSALTARRIQFCIRCDSSQGFSAVREFLLSGRREQVVVLRAPDARDAEDHDCPATPTTVRLLRVTTPNGRIHVRMTSLLDAVAFPAAAFAELYHGRRRIEEAFKRIKHRLQLEHTSGLSWHAARQDFGAKAVFDSLNAWRLTSPPRRFSIPVRLARSTAPWPSTRSNGRSVVGCSWPPPPRAASYPFWRKSL